MNIELVKIEKIKPYKNNAKMHGAEQVALLAEGIKTYGFSVPLCLDKHNVIVTGHGRFLAAKQLEMAEVPVVYLNDLTDAEVKAYRLADNALGETGYNTEALLAELEDLKIAKYDFELTGFNSKILDSSSEVNDIDPELVEPDIDLAALQQANEKYLNNTIKQIVLYYESETYADVMRLIEMVKKEEHIENNTDAVTFLIKQYLPVEVNR